MEYEVGVTVRLKVVILANWADASHFLIKQLFCYTGKNLLISE